MLINTGTCLKKQRNDIDVAFFAADEKRCPARVGALRHVSTCTEEHFDNLSLALLACRVQRRVAFSCAATVHRSACKKKF
eukprot:CAMPEP_0119302358 /NCGR_PEP_ID=MMETSP1333-20130426/3961_1 /TAXON_ID=418940 /ORGANISM="Scyphosphaera apsteinii, Strain RCC1455" /LENGTH=79 /DNA_ID=CAMNT_0007304687 /DNA_START=77 /DNA_END=316 /DNA_ORIENTATION=-